MASRRRVFLSGLISTVFLSACTPDLSYLTRSRDGAPDMITKNIQNDSSTNDHHRIDGAISNTPVDANIQYADLGKDAGISSRADFGLDVRIDSDGFLGRDSASRYDLGIDGQVENIDAAISYDLGTDRRRLDAGMYDARVERIDATNPYDLGVDANISFTLDRTPPNVTQFLLNTSDLTVMNASNFSNGGVLSFNITVNDSTLSVETVKVGLTNDFRNGTEFNITLSRNFSGYHTAVAFNTLTDGFYTLKVYANDTVGNLNNTLANLSFRIDRTPPNVTTFGMSNLSNGSNVSGGVISFNLSVNDSTLSTETVQFSIFNDFRNSTSFNITAAKNFSGYQATLILSTMTDGFYTVTVLANDTVGNRNNSVNNVSFTIDRTPPNVTTFGMSNLTNASNVSGGVIFFNVSINDSTTFAKVSFIGLTNDFRNGTQFNVTLTRNLSGFHTALILSTMTDGFYTVTVYANDSVDNVNSSVSNVSFTIDRTPPNVTTFGMNISNATSLAGGAIQFNATINDSTTSVQTVLFGFTSSVNSSEFNVTAIRNQSTYHITLQLASMGEATYTVKIYSNDTLGNVNSSVNNLSFTIGIPVSGNSNTGNPGGGSSQPTQDTEPVSLPTNPAETADSPSMGSESSSSDYSSSGTSCPPETILQEGVCVSLPPPTEQVPLEVLEEKFLEDNVFPTALPVISSVRDPFQQGLNCVVPSGESVSDIQQNVFQRAMEAIARGVTTILYEADENHLQFFFLIFEGPGQVCVTIDIHCPLPDEQRFWQFQDVFSPTSSYFNDQYCIPTDGQPLFVAQDFTMCETLYNQIEECDIRISTDVID